MPVPFASFVPEVYDDGRNYPTYLERPDEFWRELSVEIFRLFGERVVSTSNRRLAIAMPVGVGCNVSLASKRREPG